MKLANQINTIVCDDIRHEIGGKASLMGIYLRDIVVDDIPTILPTLCFMFTFEGPKTNLSGLKITIKQSDTTTNLVELKDFPDEVNSEVTANVMAKISPFRINKEEKVVIQFTHSALKRPLSVHSFKITKKASID